MSFLGKFYSDVAKCENEVNMRKGVTKKSRYIDTENLVKIILAWLVGGIISLMPIFTHILSQEMKNSYLTNPPTEIELGRVVEKFFATEDLFLVITTLTVGALFELIFNGKNGIPKYVVVSLEMILVVCSVHIFSMLQSNVHLPKEAYLGAGLMAICLANSVIGYFIACRKRGDK